MKRLLLLTPLVLLGCLPVYGQNNQDELNREVTLYNPYKPSLSNAKKWSFLPVISDTAKTRADVTYNITSSPYHPEYSIAQIKAASLLPDPLPKLYKSYLKLGFGNYFSPLAELSMTNERSKKGSLGFYAKHFSSNGKVKLQNDIKQFAGFMDNDLSLFGKKFFRKNLIEASIDFSQKTRYAYGYDTSIVGYKPEKKDIRLGYNNLGAAISFESLNLDSASFSYDFDLSYDFFYNAPGRYQHNPGLSGIMAKKYKDFYVGAELDFRYFGFASDLSDNPKIIASLSPFIKRNTPQWNFKAGLQILVDKFLDESAALHLYPDIRFGLNIVPSYVSFFTGLGGSMEVNEPLSIIEQNPFIIRDGSLFKIPNTNNALIVTAGLQGNTGIGGNYLMSASYSFINDMCLFSNLVFPDSLFSPQMGNFFIPFADDGELFRVHGEMTGSITNKVSYRGSANYYKYTLTENDYAWNKPGWDAKIGVRYNLRDKIIAGADITTLGSRRLLVSDLDAVLPPVNVVFQTPVNVNINLSAEYRYTKILSFWLKFNNISFNRYYEWAYYPSQRFLCLVGFTYSM
jgi:hypothetical protein